MENFLILNRFGEFSLKELTWDGYTKFSAHHSPSKPPISNAQWIMRTVLNAMYHDKVSGEKSPVTIHVTLSYLKTLEEPIKINLLNDSDIISKLILNKDAKELFDFTHDFLHTFLIYDEKGELFNSTDKYIEKGSLPTETDLEFFSEDLIYLLRVEDPSLKEAFLKSIEDTARKYIETQTSTQS